MKIRTSKLLFLLPILLALAACGNKGPLLPPPAPGAEDWPEASEAEAGEADDVDEVDDAEGADPVPGATSPATDGER